VQSRRQFIHHISFGAAGLTLAGVPLLAQEPPLASLTFAVRPIDGNTYPRSFLRFCERGRFSTWQDAATSVRDASLPFLVIRTT